jgi:hypothetical protein
MPQGGNFRERDALVQSVNQCRDKLFSVIEQNSIDVIMFKRITEGHGRVSAHQDESFGCGLAHFTGRFHDSVIFQCMETGNADDSGPGSTDPGCGAWAETEVGNGDFVAEWQERSGNVFESERLYPEKGSKTELFISGIGAQ